MRYSITLTSYDSKQEIRHYCGDFNEIMKFVADNPSLGAETHTHVSIRIGGKMGEMSSVLIHLNDLLGSST